MDIKVNSVQQPLPVEKEQQAQAADGSFKFTLASHIEEAGLKERLSAMM